MDDEISDPKRRVLDSFTWLEADGEDSEANLKVLYQRLPKPWLAAIENSGRRQEELVEFVAEIGRQPRATFGNGAQKQTVSLSKVICERGHIQKLLEGTFFDRPGWENQLKSRSGQSFVMQSTLNRVNVTTKGEDSLAVIGIAVRIGRAVPGVLAQMCPWLIRSRPLPCFDGQRFTFSKKSVLLIGQAGAGKTTILRDAANGLSRIRTAGNAQLSVVVVDKINEIGGESDTPHQCIGEAQWVPCDNKLGFQAKLMKEAVKNTTPDMVLTDEIGDKDEVDAARTIVESGVTLIASAQGRTIADILNCSVRDGLLGGVQRRGQKFGERVATPVFDVAIEITQNDCWIVHPNVKDSVDRCLRGERLDAIELRPGLASAVVGIPNGDGIEYCMACAAERCSLDHLAKAITPPSAGSPSPQLSIDIGSVPRFGSPSRSPGNGPTDSPSKSPTGGLSTGNYSNGEPPTPKSEKSPRTKSPRTLTPTTPSYMAAKSGASEEEDRSEEWSDPNMQSVAVRMNTALVKYFKKTGVHHNIDGNWCRFYRTMDVSSAGKISFEEFDVAIRDLLAAKISRYELIIFWRHLDADGSGALTKQEFGDVMYRIQIAGWPDLAQEAVTRITRTINKNAEKWHRCGGNWFKIFRSIKPDNSAGALSFAEFTACLRGSFPGLAIPEEKLNDEEIKGLWKLMDDDFSQEVCDKEFMNFMKREGGDMCMHKMTEYAKIARKLNDVPRDIRGEINGAPILCERELADITHRFGARLHQWLAKRGIGSGVTRADAPCLTLWERLFAFLDSDGSGRLSYDEFETSCHNDLHADEGDPSTLITDDELKSLWHYLDLDASLEMTEKEFVVGVYRLQLAACPILDDATIDKYVKIMNKAAGKWHRAAGNWYKIFKACHEGDGEMDFSEMCDIIRKNFPCLAIPAKKISYEGIKGLWRAIDDDCSGKVDFKEFMHFMRKHAPSHTQLTSYSRKQRGLCTEEKEKEAKVLPTWEEVARPLERLQEVANTLDEALAAYWAQRGVHANVSGNWARFFDEADDDCSGRLEFDELESFLSQSLRTRGTPENELITGITRDDLIALWHKVDDDDSGEVTAKEWETGLYRLEVLAWPDIDDASCTKVVDIISKAVGKWHMCQGNWFKIFRLIDLSGIGEIMYPDLFHFVYHATDPCLNLPPKRLPEAKLKGLWKAMDSEQNAVICRAKFMLFMRQHGSCDQFQSTKYRQRKKEEAAKINPILVFGPEHFELLAAALSRQSVQSLRAATSNGNEFSEWDMIYIMRELLGISEDEISDDGVNFVWLKLETSGKGSGRATIDDLLALGNYRGKRMSTQSLVDNRGTMRCETRGSLERFAAWPEELT